MKRAVLITILVSMPTLAAGPAETHPGESTAAAIPLGTSPTWVRHPGQPFSISATEITVAQFRLCLEEEQCDVGSVNASCNFGDVERDEHPINCVSHTGAEQYCDYAGGRLCTNEEWLAACKGTAARPFPYGHSFDLAACNSASATVQLPGRERGTLPVATLAQCEGGLTGLYDMAGNVAEWLSDCISQWQASADR